MRGAQPFNYPLRALGVGGGTPANQQQTFSTCLRSSVQRGGNRPGAPLITQEAAAQWTDPTEHGVPGRNSSSQRILLPDPLSGSPGPPARSHLSVHPQAARSHSRLLSSPASSPRTPARAPRPRREPGNVRHVRCAVIGSCGLEAPHPHPASRPAGEGESGAGALTGPACLAFAALCPEPGNNDT